MLSGCVFQAIDVKGRTIVMLHANFAKHRLYHAELDQRSFLPQRMQEALLHPTFTVKSYRKDSICYYLEEFEVNGVMRYTKVIVGNKPISISKQKVYIIRTAFRVDHIQELKYGHALQYPIGEKP